ncbi:hypothetical protein ACJIZ3_008561 [Penstemon smallii]|uniref:Uncharacterized protein n=1 Tax=Penstemon smallii TaxID=265156 RepID=A0ABD3TA32_9LAMI
MAAAEQDEIQRRCIRMRQDKLLQARELNGNIISCRKGKLSFQSEYQKRRASEPLIWKYRGTGNMGNIALEQVVADVDSSRGLLTRVILLTGGVDRLRILKIGKAGVEFHPSLNSYKPDCVWPLSLDHEAGHKQLSRGLKSSFGALRADITFIKAFRQHSLSTDDMMAKEVLITTRVSDKYPGYVYLLDLNVPLYYDGSPVLDNGLICLAEYKHTLWTADCDPEGTYALFGTPNGVKVLNMETGASSRLFRSTSDVLCLQVDQSIRLYDRRLTDRGPVQSYEGNVNSRTQIQFGVDPSEKVVMSGGEDCYLRLWNIKSGELLFKERFTNAAPTTVCWPRNRGILSSRMDTDQDYRDYWEDHCWGAWLGSAEGIFYMDWL